MLRRSDRLSVSRSVRERPPDLVIVCSHRTAMFVHAPQDATVSRPGEDDLLRLRASERAGWQALAAELSLDEAGDQVARRTQV